MTSPDPSDAAVTALDDRVAVVREALDKIDRLTRWADDKSNGTMFITQQDIDVIGDGRDGFRTIRDVCEEAFQVAYRDVL